MESIKRGRAEAETRRAAAVAARAIFTRDICSLPQIANLIRAARAGGAGSAGRGDDDGAGGASAEGGGGGEEAGDGIPEDEPLQALMDQEQKLRRKIAADEKHKGAQKIDELRAALDAAEAAQKRHDEQVRALKDPYRLVRERHVLRLLGFTESKRLAVETLDVEFRKYMGKKSHSGSVEVDFDASKLELKVLMSGAAGAGKARSVRDTKSLSGGERSYATLAFMLALGKDLDGVRIFLFFFSRKAGISCR